MQPKSPETGGAAAGQPSVSVMSLDFKSKTFESISLDRVPDACRSGKFCWVDLHLDADGGVPADALVTQGLCPAQVLSHARTGEPAIQFFRYEQCIHLVLVGCRLNGDRFIEERLDAIVSANALVTIHRGEPDFLRAVKREYLTDFVRHAATPSFLLYELWDHLLDNFVLIQKSFEDRVVNIQKSLAGSPDESIFRDASELGSQLLHFRKVVLPARTVLTDLSARKSAFVSEASQGFLGNMVNTVERILQDVLVDRDILSDSLNNYMSMVAHNTNKVMSKLTVVSVIFLPLTFLCGVYGMNFEVLPELKFEWAYGAFWCVVIVIALILVLFMRRIRML